MTRSGPRRGCQIALQQNVRAAFGGLRAFEDAAGMDADFHEMAAGRAPGYISTMRLSRPKSETCTPSDIRHRDSRLFPEECTKYVQFRVPAAPDLLTISRRFRHSTAIRGHAENDARHEQHYA